MFVFPNTHLDFSKKVYELDKIFNDLLFKDCYWEDEICPPKIIYNTCDLLSKLDSQFVLNLEPNNISYCVYEYLILKWFNKSMRNSLSLYLYIDTCNYYAEYNNGEILIISNNYLINDVNTPNHINDELKSVFSTFNLFV